MSSVEHRILLFAFHSAYIRRVQHLFCHSLSPSPSAFIVYSISHSFKFAFACRKTCSFPFSRAPNSKLFICIVGNDKTSRSWWLFQINTFIFTHHCVHGYCHFPWLRPSNGYDRGTTGIQTNKLFTFWKLKEEKNAAATAPTKRLLFLQSERTIFYQIFCFVCECGGRSLLQAIVGWTVIYHPTLNIFLVRGHIQLWSHFWKSQARKPKRAFYWHLTSDWNQICAPTTHDICRRKKRNSFSNASLHLSHSPLMNERNVTNKISHIDCTIIIGKCRP